MKVLPLREEEDLLDRALHGDAQAHARIVEGHYAAVYSFARKLTRDDATARDVAQETFLRAFDRLHQHDPARSLASWLFKISANLVRDFHRRNAKSDPTEDDLEELSSGPVLAKEADVAAVRRALDALPRETRAAMLLHLQEEFPIAEIAYALGLSEDAVRNKIYRGVQKVRSRVKEER